MDEGERLKTINTNATEKLVKRFPLFMMSDLPCVSHPLIKLRIGSYRCIGICKGNRIEDHLDGVFVVFKPEAMFFEQEINREIV